MDPVVVQSSSAGFRSVYDFGDQETPPVIDTYRRETNSFAKSVKISSKTSSICMASQVKFHFMLGQ